MPYKTIARILNLVADADQQILNLSVDEARALLLSENPEDVLRIEGSFALLARDGQRVRAGAQPRPAAALLPRQGRRTARCWSSPTASTRSATLWRARGTATSSTPSYTRMVPAHHVTEIQLVGCPDPNPVYRRFFDPPREVLPPDLDVIGEAYVERPLRGDPPLAGRAARRRSPWASSSPAASTAARCCSCLYHELARRRPEPGPAEGVHPRRRRRRRRPRAGARVPPPRRSPDPRRGDRSVPATSSIPSRPSRRSRTTSRSTSSARR